MNTQRSFIRSACLAILAAFALVASAGYAQSSHSLARAEIPFSFHYGNQVFPAGTYRLGMVSDHVLQVQGKTESAFAMVQWDENKEQPAQGKLVFRHLPGSYTLQDLWVPTLAAHVIVLQSRKDRHRELAQLTPTQTYVEVALADPAR